MTRRQLILGLLCVCWLADAALGGLQNRGGPRRPTPHSTQPYSDGAALAAPDDPYPDTTPAPDLDKPASADSERIAARVLAARQRGGEQLTAGWAPDDLALASLEPTTALDIPVEPAASPATGTAPAPAERDARPEPPSLPRLDVALLPGMPAEIVLGRTFEVDCTMPARDIPTQRMNFVDYLRNVLPNEWVATWSAASLDAGAVAAKQFAWYTVAQRKWRSQGYPFDLVDSTCDQLYRDGTADPRTDAAFQRTWGLLLLRDGRLIETEYRDTEATCGLRADCMGQVESAILAAEGWSAVQLLARSYGAGGTALHDSAGRLPAKLPPIPPAPRILRTATPRVTATTTPSATPTATPTPTSTPAPTSTPSPSATVTPTATLSPSPAPVETAPAATPAAPTDVTPAAPPVPSIEPVPAATPTGLPVVKLPDLVGLGENQARAALAELGIRAVFVDYQSRERLGERFDQFPPYAVVSHRPAADTLVATDAMIVLGIRAP